MQHRLFSVRRVCGFLEGQHARRAPWVNVDDDDDEDSALFAADVDALEARAAAEKKAAADETIKKMMDASRQQSAKALSHRKPASTQS